MSGKRTRMAEAIAMFTTIVSQKVIGPSRRLCVSLRGLSE
jgi:hypothetical protein